MFSTRSARRGTGVLAASAVAALAGVTLAAPSQAAQPAMGASAQSAAVAKAGANSKNSKNSKKAKSAKPKSTKKTKSTKAAEAARMRAINTGLSHRRGTQLYIVPHQDDETLTFGGAIAADVAAQRNVILVLVTQGNNTLGTKRVNDTLAAEGRERITQDEYVAGRKREFAAAAKALGVPAKNVRYLDVRDGGDTKKNMYRAVDQLVQQHGNRVAYNSMSWLDKHPTHYHLADRLDSLCRVNTLKECHFYQYGAYRVGAPKIGSVSPVVTPVGKWIPDTKGRVVKAANEYRLWDPDNGRYAIGWQHSVPRGFAALLQKPGSWTHGPSKKDQWAKPADRTAALTWIAANQKDPDPTLAKQR